MCRSCAEQPDPTKRRCNRSDGHTVPEADARNRARNATNAVDRLADGDPQAAANALTHAVAANQRLTGTTTGSVGNPSPTPGDHRDIVTNGTDALVIRTRLDVINGNRAKVGRQPIIAETTRQYLPEPQDDFFVLEQTTLRLSGADQDELDGLNVGSYRTELERKVRTDAMMNATMAIIRMDGKFIPRSSPDLVPTADKVLDYLRERPDGRLRNLVKIKDEDRRMAAEVLHHARNVRDTNEFTKALRRAASADCLSSRDVPTLASAYQGWARDNATPNVATPATQGHQSRWIGRRNEQVTIVAKVLDVQHVFNAYDPGQPKTLHVLRSVDGDLIRWVATKGQGIRAGDTITVVGKVKDHSWVADERQTEIWYAQAGIHI